MQFMGFWRISLYAPVFAIGFTWRVSTAGSSLRLRVKSLEAH
jgi:hypothetical protein